MQLIWHAANFVIGGRGEVSSNECELRFAKAARGFAMTVAPVAESFARNVFTSSRPIHVLVVDDDDADAELVRIALARAPFCRFEVDHVYTLADGHQTLATDDDVDVVLLDLGLPDQEGTEGLDLLLADFPQVPVVVLTGRNADDDTAIDLLRAGAQDYVCKNEGYDNVARTLRYALERHANHLNLQETSKKLEETTERLAQLVLLDPLTGLLNRRGLEKALSSLWSNATRGGRLPFAAVIDLDDFKRINDKLGHSVGDIVLRETAASISRGVRPADYCGRLGGDEFLVLFNVDRNAEAGVVAERIRTLIAASSIEIQAGQVHVTASISLLQLDKEHSLLDRIIASAHQSLKQSKQSGKNRVARHTPVYFDAPSELLTNENAEISLADERNYTFVKQPIVRIADGQVIGYEFLSRFAVPPYETPDAFFSLATKRNLLAVVDHICLRGIISIVTSDYRDASIHVNLFPSTLLGMNVDYLQNMLDGVSPNNVCIELSEQQILGDPFHLLENMQPFRDAGFRFALDDVGFGRSCLESLLVLDPDVIKLDKRCVMGVGTRPRLRKTLERLVKISQTTTANVIAEGVETEADREVLETLGVLEAQGYLWGKPA